MTSILDFLTDSQIVALRTIPHSRATSSIKALVTRGLAERDETGGARLTRNGKLALRELEQRDGLRPVFKVHDRVEFVNWRISKDEWIAEVYTGVVIGSNAYGVNVADEHGTIRAGISHYRVFKAHEPLTEQPAPVQEHPAIVALRSLDIDRLGPIEALTKLYELKRMAGQG